MINPKLIFWKVSSAAFGTFAWAVLAVPMALCASTPKRANPPDLLTVALCPQGDRLVFSSVGRGGNDLYCLNLHTNGVERLTESADFETCPAFSPDGKSIAYAAMSDDTGLQHLYLMDLATKSVKPLTSGEQVYDSMPRFSPDGLEIAFVRSFRLRDYSWGGTQVWDHADICILNTTTLDVRRLSTEEYSYIYAMEYAPNGDTLLYAAPPPRSGGFEKHPILFALRPKTDSRPRILSGGGQGGPHRAIETIDFAIFPDGNSLLYRKKEPQNTGGLWHLNLVSGEEKALAVDGLVTDPMISRDGETIYFLVNHQEKGSQLWWFNVADQSPKKLAGEELFNDPLNWKPAEDGKSVK